MADGNGTGRKGTATRWAIVGAAVGAIALTIAVVVWLILPAAESPTALATPKPAASASAPATPSPTPTPLQSSSAWPETRLQAAIAAAPTAAWSSATGVAITPTGRVGEALVTVTGTDSLTLALIDTVTGDERWRSVVDDRPGRLVLWAATPSDEHIVVLSKTGDTAEAPFRLTALDRRTGGVVSHSPDRQSIVGIPSIASRWMGATASAGGAVVVYADDGRVSALLPADLTTAVWSIDAAAAVPHGSYFEVETNILAAGEVIFVGRTAHSLSDGADLGWQASGGSWFAGDGALVHLMQSGVTVVATALEVSTGEPLWEIESEHFVSAGSRLLSLRAGRAYRVDPVAGSLTEIDLVGTVPDDADRIQVSLTDVVSISADRGRREVGYLHADADRAVLVPKSELRYQGRSLSDGRVILSAPGFVYIYDPHAGMLFGMPVGATEATWASPGHFDDMDLVTNTVAGGTLFDRTGASGIVGLK